MLREVFSSSLSAAVAVERGARRPVREGKRQEKQALRLESQLVADEYNRTRKIQSN
jgi:hypothetical protein